jgi:hypothetical protein
MLSQPTMSRSIGVARGMRAMSSAVAERTPVLRRAMLYGKFKRTEP